MGRWDFAIATPFPVSTAVHVVEPAVKDQAPVERSEAATTVTWSHM